MRSISTDQLTILCQPTTEDGARVYDLIKRCPPLDTNSMYCNLLQCSHFTKTSVAAFQNGDLVGFVSGYRIPERHNTLFVWQVAVSEHVRGTGLAGRMLNDILSRPCNSIEIQQLETTITESNHASWKLFKSFARKTESQLEISPLFTREKHFDQRHDTEFLVRINLAPTPGSQRVKHEKLNHTENKNSKQQ